MFFFLILPASLKCYNKAQLGYVLKNGQATWQREYISRIVKHVYTFYYLGSELFVISVSYAYTLSTFQPPEENTVSRRPEGFFLDYSWLKVDWNCPGVSNLKSQSHRGDCFLLLRSNLDCPTRSSILFYFTQVCARHREDIFTTVYQVSSWEMPKVILNLSFVRKQKWSVELNCIF